MHHILRSPSSALESALSTSDPKCSSVACLYSQRQPDKWENGICRDPGPIYRDSDFYIETSLRTGMPTCLVILRRSSHKCVLRQACLKNGGKPSHPFSCGPWETCAWRKTIASKFSYLVCPFVFYHFSSHLFFFLFMLLWLLFVKKVRYLRSHPKHTESAPPGEVKT